MARGIKSRALGPKDDLQYPVPFLISEKVTGAETKKVFDKNAPFSFKILDGGGIMLAAGTAGDTVKVTDGTNDITNTADISALADKTSFDFTTIDDAEYEVAKGGSLSIVTAGGPTTNHVEVRLLCVRT